MISSLEYDAWVDKWKKCSTARTRVVAMRESLINVLNLRNAIRSGSVKKVQLCLPRILRATGATRADIYTRLIMDLMIDLETMSDRHFAIICEAWFVNMSNQYMASDNVTEGLVKLTKPFVEFHSPLQFWQTLGRNAQTAQERYPNHGKDAGGARRNINGINIDPVIAKIAYDYMTSSGLLDSTTFVDTHDGEHSVKDSGKLNHGIDGTRFEHRQGDPDLQGASVIYEVAKSEVFGNFNTVQSSSSPTFPKTELTAATSIAREANTLKSILAKKESGLRTLMTKAEIQEQNDLLFSVASDSNDIHHNLVPCQVKKFALTVLTDRRDTTLLQHRPSSRSSSKQLWADCTAQLKNLFNDTTLKKILQRHYSGKYEETEKRLVSLLSQGFGSDERAARSRDRIANRVSSRSFPSPPSNLRLYQKLTSFEVMKQAHDKLSGLQANYTAKRVKRGNNCIARAVAIKRYEWVKTAKGEAKQGMSNVVTSDTDRRATHQIIDIATKLLRRQAKGINHRRNVVNRLRLARGTERKHRVEQRCARQKKQAKKNAQLIAQGEKVRWSNERDNTDDPIPLILTKSARRQIALKQQQAATE